MERKLREKNFRKFGYTLRGYLVFGHFGKCSSIRSRKLAKIQTGVLVEWKAPCLI